VSDEIALDELAMDDGVDPEVATVPIAVLVEVFWGSTTVLDGLVDVTKVVPLGVEDAEAVRSERRDVDKGPVWLATVVTWKLVIADVPGLTGEEGLLQGP
jgi:hypothetical protein